MADTNKIRYGLKNVVVFPASIAADGSATYGDPIPVPGAVSLSLDAQGESTPFYADNIKYFISVSDDGYEGTLEVAKIPDAVLTALLNFAADKNGVLYENADASPAHFAMAFQFEGDAHAKRHVLYNCVATRPSVAGQTKEEQISPQTESLSITCSSIYIAALQANVVKAMATPSETTQYNAWLTAVYQPVAPD